MTTSLGFFRTVSKQCITTSSVLKKQTFVNNRLTLHRNLRTNKHLTSSSSSSSSSSLSRWSQYAVQDDELDAASTASPDKKRKLKVLKYPNPLLRSENAVINTFDDELNELATDMLAAMYTSDGVGLAAPQVGINKRLMVFNEAGEQSQFDLEMVLINPTIISTSEETDLKEEGCLSFPQVYGKVVRHKQIEVEYQNIKGEKITKTFNGFPARIFQHEYDHLDKVLFIDRLVDEDKAANKKRLDKIVKKYGPGGAI